MRIRLTAAIEVSTRVLLVEDESRTRGALHEYFTLHGFDVRSTDDAVEAIQIGREFLPHVLLCDWWLGGTHSGIDVARTLADTVAGLEILFMTGYPLKDLELKCDDLSVKAFFKKPLRLSEVRAVIERAAGS